jgi:hypothetical protein
MALVFKPARKGKPKYSHDEIIRRLRLGDLRKLIADRCRGFILPDDDAGIEYLRELLLPISIGPYEARNRVRGGVALWGPVDRMKQEIARWAPWMGGNRVGALIDEINQMPMWQRKPRARMLGDRLNVTYGQRQKLALRTIAPCDVSDAAMELIRKRKRRKRDKERRQLQSRANYLADHTKSKEQPWVGLGISRRTYYRRLKAGGTSLHPINLNKSSCTPVPSEKRVVSKEGAVRANSIKQVSNQMSESQKTEMAVIHTHHELVTQTCAKPEQTSNDGDLRGMPKDLSAHYPPVPSYCNVVQMPTILPPGVSPNAIPSWVLMLPPDMAAMATVAWFYGSLPELDMAA